MSDETKLPLLQARVLKIVSEAKQGITISELVDAAYKDEEDGGPLYAIGTVQGTIVKLNHKLTASNLKIKATGFGRGTRFKLVKIE